MRIIRPINPKDQKAFETFAQTMTYGVTSLPKDPELLKDKIDKSLRAFAEQRLDPHSDLYIFVMENSETGVLEGTSAIRALTGGDEPFYFYRLQTVNSNSETPHVKKAMTLLSPIKHEKGPSEICGLYLMPEFRKGNHGKLLSYSRFLFIAAHGKRFSEQIMADMRGIITEGGECLFWNGIGRHFFQVPFETVLDLASYSKKFLEAILPAHPIYIDLLPPEVQAVIGKAHKNTEAALNMLIKEGFQFTGEVSIFDGGPKIAAFTHEIRSIRKSKIATVQEIVKSVDSQDEWLIGNLSLNFRAVMQSIGIIDENKIALTKETAEALHVKAGDRVRIVEK